MTISQQRRAQHKATFKAIGEAISAFKPRDEQAWNNRLHDSAVANLQFHIKARKSQDPELCGLSAKYGGPALKTFQFEAATHRNGQSQA